MADQKVKWYQHQPLHMHGRRLFPMTEVKPGAWRCDECKVVLFDLHREAK